GHLSKAFCGYCDDTLPSALLYLSIQKALKAEESKDDEKKEQMQTTYEKLETIQFDSEELRSQLLDLFLPLCQPEEVINAKIDKDIQFYSLVASPPLFGMDTNKKENAVTDQQKKSRDQMLMVITNDVERNIPIKWLHYTKKIMSFKKISEFENTIAEFFKSKVPSDVLIFQHRHTSESVRQLEQVIYILQFEHNLFYSDPNNSEKKKLVVLLINTTRESSFPLVFRQKWKIVYVDYLLSTSPISLQKDLKKKLADIIDKQDLFKCAHRVFGRLHFSHSFKSLEEKKILRLIFRDEKFENCKNLLIKRLKELLSKAAENRSIDDILQDLEKGRKENIEGPFFARHQNNIDTLLTLTLVNVLFVIYQNGGFADYAKSKKNEEDGHQWYSELFEKALNNQKLVKMKTPSFNPNQLLLF
ncbi:hypothetical protein RFI_38256, partial [Reticulomyxa filosa]